jgi:hypothetical protein
MFPIILRTAYVMVYVGSAGDVNIQHWLWFLKPFSKATYASLATFEIRYLFGEILPARAKVSSFGSVVLKFSLPTRNRKQTTSTG